ncbi:MAG: metal ABC transporter substrate-binding protein [Firmicutes bacterium HGW-Firmicutes-14]|nr:MAG: metal ABC transporter substrate-binding protein [Firmicutes bacterium HGW-Firmicutes-14]
MRKRLVLITAAFLSLVLFAGLFAGCGTNKTGSEKKDQSLKIGVLYIEDNLPLFVAEAEKRFEKAGIDVALVPFPSAAERDAAIQAGQIDGEAADIVAASLLKKGGTDVRITSITLGVTPEEGRFVLLGSPDSEFNSVSDLADVDIAISENTIIEYITDMLLLRNGLEKDQIKKLGIPKMPIRLQMLVNNQVKAALLPDPLASLAEKQGARVILDDTMSDMNVSQVVMLFRKDSIDSKKESIKKLIDIYGEAAAALTQNPEQYRSLLIEKARIPEPVKNTYKSPTFSPPQAPSEQDVLNVVNWMVDKKLLDKPFTYDELVDDTLI